MKKILILVLVFSLQGISYSAEKNIKAPHFRLQGIQGTNSGLSMWCSGQEPYNEIDCSFIQIFISAIPIEKTALEKKELVIEAKKFTQKDIDVLQDTFKDTDLDNFLKNMDTASSEQKAYMQKSLKILKGLKQAKIKEQLTKAISDSLDFKGATCTISEQTFDRHLTKISKNKWLYNPGPVGLCNVVRIATLENTPEFPRLWTYSEKTEAFDESNPTCKEWVGSPKTFISSWDNPSGFKFEQCKYLQIGN